jgi:hypothetical protein
MHNLHSFHQNYRRKSFVVMLGRCGAQLFASAGNTSWKIEDRRWVAV